MNNQLSTGRAFLLFGIVVFAWGTNWPVTKLLVENVPPLWTSAIRCGIGALALLPLLLFRGRLTVPDRGDLPVVLSIALLHMVAFSALVAAGLQFLPASQAIVLGYTTPIWVALGAFLLLGEALTNWRITGIILGLVGLAVIFNPLSFDWTDRQTIYGCGLTLLAAMCWAASIVYVRAHKWIGTPFELTIWQLLLATIILSLLALIFEGPPIFQWNTPLLLLFLYGGCIGSGLAYWAMSMVNRSLPAITTSLGILATPLVGIVCATLALAESLEPSLLIAAGLIVGGVALGALDDRRRNRLADAAATHRPH